MVTFVGINFLIYLITIFYIQKKIINFATKMNYSFNNEVVFRRLLTLQEINEELIPIVPLIPVVNVVYSTKLLILYNDYKHYIYKEFVKEKIFIPTERTQKKETIKIEMNLENILEELLNELDTREYTKDDLTFLRATLELFKLKYTSTKEKEILTTFEEKIINLVNENVKTKKLQK